MNPDLLARLCAIARGDYATVTPSADVTGTSQLRQRLAELRQLRPKIVEGGNRETEASTASDGALSDADAGTIEERAGLAADRVPPVYLDAWARLNCQKPSSVSEAQWRLALDDGGRFLDASGNKAADLGWTPGELFDVTVGLAWRLAGERVEAIGADHVRLSNGRIILRGRKQWTEQRA
jgi:hypothetical protein